ncbi:MAG: MerR family transcriptional regulator [Desulfovibrio sp.]|uniref:MerR family transcriptional regulator n=1 Tax=Desulfovibrio sp. TaxID=885 RepID=UPI00258CF280|nr:MerR family transcriptional regulator [Desulfovibrio sp.]MCD7984792.1 MerR family transcriptional regulator [Desulfovibrio sp.]
MARTASRTEGLLSIADISRHFSLPESTTRYYCKRFAAFIPSVGEGRRRRYRPETLEVIAAILEQMQTSRTAAAVENTLLARFPRNALAVPGPEPCPVRQVENLVAELLPTAALQLLERQTQALESIAQLMHAVIERLPQTGAAASETARENQQLRSDVENLRVLLHASEKTQQADLDQLRAWMTRVIQRRDKTAPAD